MFSLVALALKVAFPGEMSRQVSLSLNEILHSYLYPNDNPLRELWFIVALFWFFVLTPIWRVLLRRKWLMWSTLVVLTFLHLVQPKIDFLCIGSVCKYAIWFYLGMLLSKKEYVEKYVLNKAWLTFISGVALYVIGLFLNPFIVTMGGITLSLGLAIIADAFIPKLFFTFRDYTYQIFLMGIFAQMFVKIVYRHISIPYVLAYMICIAAGLYVPVLVSKVIEKINWKPLSLCVGLKTK